MKNTNIVNIVYFSGCILYGEGVGEVSVSIRQLILLEHVTCTDVLINYTSAILYQTD